MAAAARLDAFNASGITVRRRKGRPEDGEHARAGKRSGGGSNATDRGFAAFARNPNYSPKGRESLALWRATQQAFGGASDSAEDHGKPPPLEGTSSEEEGKRGDESERGEGASSVIVTPGPPPLPDSGDEGFIKPDGEGESEPGPETGSDPEFELTDEEGTDGDDEGE